MPIPEFVAYRTMSVFLSAMMVFSTVILPLNTVDANSPIIGRSNTIDVDNDGFVDSQDACPKSLQNWIEYSQSWSLLDLDSLNLGDFDFALDSQGRVHVVNVYYQNGENVVKYSRQTPNGSNLTNIYTKEIASGNQSGDYLSMVLDSNDNPKILYSSRNSYDWLELNLAEWNGSNWTTKNFGISNGNTINTTSHQQSGNYGYHADIAINDFDDIFITYFVKTSSWPYKSPIVIASRLSGSNSWNANHTTTVDQGAGGGQYGTGHELAIGIDNNNSPIVFHSGKIWLDYPANNNSQVDGWRYYLVRDGPAEVSSQGNNRSRAEIVVDQNDAIHIIGQTREQTGNYVDGIVQYSVINSINYNGANGANVGSVSHIYNSGGYLSTGNWGYYRGGGSIVLDSNDEIHLAHGIGNHFGPVYLGPSGGINYTSEMTWPRYAEIELDSNDRPFILSTDTHNAIKLISRTGSPVHNHSDSDGCDDLEDAIPNDSTQWNDIDGDGYGDNLNGNNPDVFPNDSTQWNDTDGDGYGDNLNGNNPDIFPNDSTQWNDTDGDGYGDNLNGTNGDQLPLDPSDWLDFDSDGIGDSSDPDDDDDGYNDSIDVWPFDNCSWFDRDSDGKPDVILQGCNTPLIEDGDDDGDTKLDQDDFCPVGEINWLSGAVTDHDADGCRDDGEDIDDDNDGLNDSIDLCARGHVGWVSNPSADADNDGCHDTIEDNDDDNDGVSEPGDQCPNTPIGVTVDVQGCPLDSDNDGVADYLDNCSNTPSGVIVDTNGCPVDSDGDGTPDYQDSFPNDANETADSDGDGVGDNSDSFPNDANETADSDGDGVGDNSDSFPNDANETADSDGDGVGDNSDSFPNDVNETADSDGDGVGDNSDECQSSNPMDEVESDGCVLKTSTSETSSLVTPTIIGISTGLILLTIMAVVLIRRTGGSIEEEILFDQEPIPANSPIEIDVAPEIVSQDTNPPESEIGVLGDDGYYWLEWPSASGSWYYRAPSETIWNYFEK